MKDLTKGSITKLIFWFALPVFIGSLLQMTYNLVDTKIIGYVLGESSLAAVGSTNSVNTLVIGFLQGLTNGFAVIAAQFFGAGDTANFKRTVAGSFKYGIMISAGLTVVVLIFLRPLLKVLNTPEDLLKEAYDYIFIIFAGMTILMLYNVCAALLRSIGDSFTPLIFLGISVVLNIGGDLFFLKVIPMGVRGAAVATVLSQLIALIACLIYSLKRYNILWIEKKDFKSDASLCGKLMSTGCSMGFMSSLVSIGSVTLQSAINSFGQDIILAHTMGWVWCVLCVITSYTIVPAFVKMLISSDNRNVIDTATLYLRVDSLLYFVTAMITIIRNSLQGIGDRLTPIISSGIELAGKVVITFTLVPLMGYWGVIVSEPIVWVLMVIPLIVQLIKNPAFARGKNNGG